jgi:hypothetical protein
LVSDYTLLALTYEKDVFPALSGLARQFQEVAGLDYVAGLWRQSLVEDLLWHVDLHVESRGWLERPAWRAPSWSWASVRGAVEFVEVEGGMEEMAEVVGVACETAGPDSMGELVEGVSYLVMRGRVVPATARLKSRGAHEDSYPWKLVELDILDGHLKNLWVDYNCCDVLDSGTAASGTTAQAFCFYLGKKWKTGALIFLILVSEGQKSCLQDSKAPRRENWYRRIGLVEVFGGPPGRGWVSSLLGRGFDIDIRIL